jgi:hypothetical protein
LKQQVERFRELGYEAFPKEHNVIGWREKSMITVINIWMLLPRQLGECSFAVKEASQVT